MQDILDALVKLDSVNDMPNIPALNLNRSSTRRTQSSHDYQRLSPGREDYGQARRNFVDINH